MWATVSLFSLITGALPQMAQAQSFLIYAGTSTGDILAINPTTGGVTNVKTTGFSNINGLAWDQATERLYFSRTLTAPGDTSRRVRTEEMLQRSLLGGPKF